METVAALAAMRDDLIEALSKNREVERIGGFTYLRHHSDTLVWLNQTIPTGPCTAEDLQTLIQRCEATGREPFFEFSPELSPEVPHLLESAGLKRIKTMPLMVLLKGEWSPRPYSQKARIPGREDLAPGIRAANEAFGHTGEEESGVERLEAAMADGRLLISVGFSGNEVVAMGQAVGTSRIREVAGVGTRPAFQRQGFGGAVIECLLDQFFTVGGEIAWLTPGDDGAESLYSRLGFRQIATQACYSTQPPA